MKLKDFKSAFKAKIIQRGKDYYKDGHVENLVQINATNWQAEVQGSDIYVVDVVMDETQNISYMDCDCPYEDYCKHIVAVLFAMQALPKKTGGKVEGASPLNMEQLLKQKTKAQLVELILTLSSKHSSFKKELELLLTPQENELEAARKLIRYYVKAAQDRSGYIAYRATSTAVEGIYLVHERIENHLDEGAIPLAVQLTLLCVRESMHILECGDDSSGELGSAVSMSVDLLTRILEEGNSLLHDEQKLEILAQVEHVMNSEALQDWADWQFDLLVSCLPLAEGVCEQPFLLMMQRLEQQHKQGWSATYLQGRIEWLKQQLVTRALTDEQALEYLKTHPENDDLRQRLIEGAFERSDYALVLKLAQQGNMLKTSQRSWDEELFFAHKALNNKLEMRLLAQQLLLKGDGEYYSVLKTLYAKNEWLQQREELLEQLASKNRYLYGRFIVEDQLFERILTFCQQQPYMIGDYYMHLVGRYDSEAEQLFVDEIIKNAEDANNRSHYSRIGQLIAVMQKAGYKQRAAALIETLKQQNKRRPAFIDELNKIS